MARSRAYPVVDLPTAIEGIGKVADQLGRGTHDRESVAKALGYSSGTGLAARRVAALVQFGFLSRSGAAYSTTELAEELLHPRSDTERAHAIRTTVGQVAVFRELIEKFEPQGRVPAQLANILVRDHGITREAAEDVAGVFLRSAQHAGVLDPDGRFTGAPSPPPTGEDGVRAAHQPPVNSGVAADGASRSVTTPAELSGHPAPGLDSQVLRITLSGGIAELRVPYRLTGRDLAKLRKWLELVGLDVEEPDDAR